MSDKTKKKALRKPRYFYNAVTNETHHAGVRGDACRERALLTENVEKYESITQIRDLRAGRNVEDKSVGLCGHEEWTEQEQADARAA